MFWLIAAVFLSSLVLSFAMMPKPQVGQKPAGLSELQAPTAEVNREIPLLAGTRDMPAPNVVWYGDLRTVAIKAKGGKK